MPLGGEGRSGFSSEGARSAGIRRALQRSQYRLPVGFIAPHIGQRRPVEGNGLPHSLQNLLPSRFAVPHFGQ